MRRRPFQIALRRLRNEVRGVAAVEFAMIAPVLMLLIVGTLEIAHMMTVQVSLESAVADASRVTAVQLDRNEDDRDTEMRAFIERRMSVFPIAKDGKVEIATTVYRNFGSSYPEAYQDSNGNGRYDGPSLFGLIPGEPFDDRNRNGVRDLATPISGKLGGPGDVVSYTATFPSALYFDFFTFITGSTGFTVRATTVLRNEPVKSKGSSGS